MTQNRLYSLIDKQEFVKFHDKDHNEIKIKCKDIKCHSDCKKKGSYCYKGECLRIHRKCSFSKNCLNDLVYKNPDCCVETEYCNKTNYCDPLDNIDNNLLLNGYYCKNDKNCKSGTCNKNLKKCMSKSMKDLYCANNGYCEKHEVYGHKHNACITPKNGKNGVCYINSKFPKESRKGGEICLENYQCKNKKCGNTYPYKHHSEYSNYKKCVQNIEESTPILKTQHTELPNIIKDLDSLDKVTYIYFEDIENKYLNKNNTVIIKKGTNYTLGKFIIQKIDDIDIYTILYLDLFDKQVSNFSEALKHLKIITSSKDNLDYFSYDYDKNNKQNEITHNLEWHKRKSLKINNKFIFEYICFKIFGHRELLVDKGLSINDYQNYKSTGYYKFSDKVTNFDEHPRNETFLYTTHNKDDKLLLSVPFSVKNGGITSVKESSIKAKIEQVKKEIDTSYYNLNYKEYDSLVYENTISFKLDSYNNPSIDKISTQTRKLFIGISRRSTANITNLSVLPNLINNI